MFQELAEHTSTEQPSPQKQQIAQPSPNIPITLAYLYVIYILILFKSTLW
jgi:hypothetical protein